MSWRTIVADPPWPLEGDSQVRSRPWACKGGRRMRSTFFPYRVMPLDWIKALPVGDWADSDAHLYLWVPASFNREGHGVAVARAWGFGVVSEIVWMKPNFGLGKFPRPQHEILLVCRRGSLPFQLRDVGSVQLWRRAYGRNNGGKVHSVKPEGAYALIERASPGPYLELFARRPRLGWDLWGDEAPMGVALEGVA